jgi:hypothetical protein
MLFFKFWGAFLEVEGAVACPVWAAVACPIWAGVAVQSKDRKAEAEDPLKVVVVVAEAEAAAAAVVFAEVSYNCLSYSFTLIAITVVA